MYQNTYGYLQSEPPRGGRLELFARITFWLALVGLLGLKFAGWRPDPMHEQMLTPDAQAHLVIEASKVRYQFLAKNGDWTALEAAQARNQLVEMRDVLPREGASWKAINDLMSDVVDAAYAQSSRNMNAANVEDRARGVAMSFDLNDAYNKNLPATYKPPLAEISAGEIFSWLGVGFLKLQLLCMVFAFLRYMARLHYQKMNIADELLFGGKNLLLSTVLWPFGLSEYPRDAAVVIRRRYVEASLRARLKKQYGEDLTALEQRQLEEIVMAPKEELKARLNAIAELPLHVRMWTQAAAAITVLIGMLLAPFNIARAQSRSDGKTTSPRGEPPAQIEKAPEPWKARGFVQTQMELTEPKTLAVSRILVFAEGSPSAESRVNLSANLTKPALLGAYGTWTPPAVQPIEIAFGQLFLRGAYLVPAPDQERLIGGPDASALLSFIDIGVEVKGTHGPAAWSVAVISGAGPNVPDNNAAKDVVGWGKIGPIGPLTLQAVCQVGEQPDGIRIRSAGELALDLDSVHTSLLATHELAQASTDLEGRDTLAASALVGWRAHEHLDVAVGYDVTQQEGVSAKRRVRAQATGLALKDTIRLGAMYAFDQTSADHSGMGRVQFSF